MRRIFEPIRFTPFVERGYRAIPFEGLIGLTAVFGEEWDMNLPSPTGYLEKYAAGHGEAYELPLAGTVRKAA